MREMIFFVVFGRLVRVAIGDPIIRVAASSCGTMPPYIYISYVSPKNTKYAFERATVPKMEEKTRV